MNLRPGTTSNASEDRNGSRLSRLVQKKKTAAGTVRWRVRIEWDMQKKITVPVSPQHIDFMEYYTAAREGQKLAKLAKPKPKPHRGTLDELRVLYLAAMDKMVEAGNMSPLTRSSRERAMRQACDIKRGGHRLGALKAELPKEAFVFILDSFGILTGAADTCLRGMKAAFKWGADRGFPDNSPVHRLTSPHISKGGATAWTDADEELFLACHGPGTMARRWFLQAKNTAGRIGDTHWLGPKNILLEDGFAFFAWQPSKKGSKFVKVPVMPEFAEELSRGPVCGEAFLATSLGLPFASSGGLDNRIRDWVIEAGLYKIVDVENPETKVISKEKKAARSQHGIRKMVALEIAHAGGSVYEIMAHLSHSDTKSAAPYTVDFERAKLNKVSAARVAAAREKSRSVPRPEDRGTLDTPNPIKI